MSFRKYPSIENYYRDKYIRGWVDNKPELMLEKFIVVEKIHGANFQIIIEQDKVQFASRNMLLKEDSSFFGYQDVMKKCSNLISKLQEVVIEEDIKRMRVFGELFGANIQKGVDYGDEKNFKLFDIYVDEDLLSQADTLFLLEQLDLEGYFVPIIDIVEGLEKALEVDTEFNTKLSDKTEGNVCEGVVIKPYNRVFEFNEGSVFYLKKKNDKFMEKQTSKTMSNPKSFEFTKLQQTFKGYLNDNRVQSAFSKMGEIENPKQIGQYIKIISSDAREDFLKDYKEEFLGLVDKERSSLFSCAGKEIALLLKDYL